MGLAPALLTRGTALIRLRIRRRIRHRRRPATAGLVHLRGRVAQRRADLLDLNLNNGALLALAGFQGTAA